MSTPVAGMTVEEFMALHGDDRSAELVDGVVVINPPNFMHGFVQARIITALSVWADAGPDRGMVLVTLDVTLTDRDAYEPDTVWVSEDRVPAEPDGAAPRVPSIAVEVRSPSTWRYDTGRKRDVYEAGGLPELWLVDPYEEVVTVCRRSDPAAPTFDAELRHELGDALRSPQLPGFELPLERIFKR
jgi:Uma2 family endonuclease